MTRATFTGPAHPIGYVELQTSWVGPMTFEQQGELLADLIKRGGAEHPGMVVDNHRIEQVRDGAGVVHHNLYLGLRPAVAAAEPLDPHNLNDAPRPVAGWPEPEDGMLPLGSRETKF
jgi:hypothetical protein